MMSVRRGPEDKGAIGLPCATCPSVQEFAGRIARSRRLATGASEDAMGGPYGGRDFVALSFDPARGGMTLETLIPHLNTSLVLWAWSLVSTSGAFLAGRRHCAMTSSWHS